MINMLDHQFLVLITNEYQNWKCYGHLNFRIIALMPIKKMLYVLPKIKMPKDLCEEYFIFKKERKTFKHDLPMMVKCLTYGKLECKLLLKKMNLKC